MYRSILTYCVLLALPLYGQGRTDSVAEKNKGKSVSINVGLNMVMRGFNRIILKDEYAQINLRSMRTNLKTWPVWDTNRFSTNFIGHPYHGSMYFSSARTNGLGFYQSSVVSMAGSLMWEYLMETKPPSQNDLWATTIGGTALGETLFRFSDLVLDNRTTGLERVGRELLAGILAPTRLITRLTTGEAWRTGQSRGNFLHVPSYWLELYFGETATGTTGSNPSMWRSALGIELLYGELFETVAGKPYDWFRLTGEIRAGNNYLHLTQANTLGLILNKELLHNNETRVTVGLFQHFNYYDLNGRTNNNTAPVYISEAAAIGPGIIVQKKKDKSTVQFAVHLSGIILGASTSDHFKLEDRDYNFGSGFSLKLSSSLQFKQRLTISLFSEDYFLFSWKGVDDYEVLKQLTINEIDFLNVQGDKSSTMLNLLGLTMKYSLNKRVHVVLRARSFNRNTLYTHFPSVKHSLNEFFFGMGVNV